MEVIEVVNRLKELGSIASLSSSDKAEIESLYALVLDKKFVRTSCSDCYHDAVIEMSVYLNKNGKMKEKSEYGLKNGVLLQMGFGSEEMYTNANLTDEVAEKYLAKYPDNIKYFSKKPDDWEERVKSRKNGSVLIDDELVYLMVESMKDGVTCKSIQEEFKSYKISGKTITKKSLTAHVNKALEVFAEMQENPSGSEDGESSNEQESTGEQNDEEGEAVEGAE
ncbi:hypothetical protein QUW56_02775 [Phocaeicola barnesiae]|uniref:hypothetical protein n=1 Tax=Phocaeicola barnesiae TaxID=376804 RepID=UPI0025A49592|nr:hypothetical protein [Phocaeicola barnesiae]MDM8232323.1 hypothetical protein [Phocaeicola barnesiae]